MTMLRYHKSINFHLTAITLVLYVCASGRFKKNWKASNKLINRINITCRFLFENFQKLFIVTLIKLIISLILSHY